MDSWTAETVKAMCRYIEDDRRIARHVGCAVAEVQKVRRDVRPNASARLAGPKLAIERARPGRSDGWQREARLGTDRLREAIERCSN